jgi:RHS repeat-associated protein
MNYFYDLIGNRTSATENSATTTYASNLVNQYTAVNAVVPVYDLDGNMTNYNGWTYTYNGENRLIVAENAASGVRVEADYDYMGRRIFKKVYNNNTLVKHSVFVYDGFKQIAEFDALNNNFLKASYLWQPVGLDVVLLRNSEYLIADGNKNIIQVRNVTGSVTDSYVYDPFGKVAHNGSSENSFQFSSEFFDRETGLVYYNYRYYSQNLGRWINRDPIEEEGSENLYTICRNNNNLIDKLGLISIIIHGTFASKTSWWTRNGGFATNLDAVLGDVWKIRTDGYKPFDLFSWSGENSHSARITSGHDLACYIIKIRSKYPKEPINIIAHSHGGNVVWEALRVLYKNKQKRKYRVTNVAFIATPQIKITYGSWYTHRWYEYLYASMEGMWMIQNKAYNFYSIEDSVQTFGADLIDGIDEKDIPNSSLEWGDSISADRTVNYIRNNFSIGTDVGPKDAHSVLHSANMGRYIGYILSCSNHAEAAKKATMTFPITNDDDTGE